MYCNNCGSEIAEGGKFCSNCGTPVPAPTQPTTGVEEPPEPLQTENDKSDMTISEEIPKKTGFAEFQWNVEDYPSRSGLGKTDDVDFNWNASLADLREAEKRTIPPAGPSVEDIIPEPVNIPKESEPDLLEREDLHNSIFGQVNKPADSEAMSAADRIDKFYTFNRKNEEFQQLLNREYEKVKSGNAIEHEISEAEKNAQQRFDSRVEDPSMEAFLEREGIVKPYQPKAFESDVLQRIEAQEAEKEAKRIEEEARLKAIEEARLEAEAKKRAEEEAARLAEIAKKKAEEDAARLAEIAKKKAEEEARAAEEARLRAAEEARLRAEEEARRKAAEEARLKAEAEAKVKAAEEARLRAEADLRAAQEAAKIRAQQEARLAAQAEERFKAEQERKKLEATEAQRKLEEKRKRIADEANQAAAAAEARKVLEQTSRMREEEAAKIKAAVANLRNGASAALDDQDGVMPQTSRRRSPQVRKEVQEAHQATKNQINEMAQARNAYFAELEELQAETPKAEEPVKQEESRTADKNSSPVTGRATMLSHNDLGKTRVVDKGAILAGLEGATKVPSKKVAPAPASDEDFFKSLDAAAEAPVEEIQENDIPESMEFGQNINDDPDVDDLLSQFESISNVEEEQLPEGEYQEEAIQQDNYGLNETAVLPQNDDVNNASVNDFDNYGNEEAANYINQQRSAMDDFYGEGIEEEPLSKKELRAQAREERRLEKLRAKEAKAAEKAAKKNSNSDIAEDAAAIAYGAVDHVADKHKNNNEGGGKGRVVLKVILVILILVLAMEVAGMVIKIAAPQSKAAEFINNQFNKVYQLVTGDDTEYNAFALEIRAEATEDKTDFINLQQDKNKDGNIKEIVYNAELKYDPAKDADVSDLVLSQPMTTVEWGRDEENYPVYYDEQVVGQLISFLSNRVNLMNNGDETALGMINKDAELYKKTAALKGKKMKGEFTKLEIGEIRQAGSNYYVWVRETIGDTAKEKVYSMYPEKKFVMKMAACFEN